nr:protein phosphatase 2C domain-containing protein [Geobacteraceae bacterium]
IGLVRRKNEDSFILFVPDNEDLAAKKGVLAIVADGVGGGNSGKTASNLAVSVIRERYYASSGDDPQRALRESLIAANREILAKAASDRSMAGMATTCTAFVMRGNQGFFSHAGDSRAYLFRRGALRQLSEDHTLVNKLLKDGLITDEAARNHPRRNIIVKALGGIEDLEPDSGQLFLEGNDIILLCSDGLHGPVSDGVIASTLTGLPLHEAGRSLVNQAKEGGGADNITVVLLRVPVESDPKGNATRPFRVESRKRKKAVLLAVFVALLVLAGGFFYIWTEAGFNKSEPADLDGLIKINK